MSVEVEDVFVHRLFILILRFRRNMGWHDVEVEIQLQLRAGHVYRSIQCYFLAYNRTLCLYEVRSARMKLCRTKPAGSIFHTHMATSLSRCLDPKR